MGSRIGIIIVIIVALGIGLYLVSSGALTKGIGGLNALFPTPSGTSFFGSGASSSSGSSFWSFLGPGSGNIVNIPPPQQTEISQASGSGSGSSGSGAVGGNPNLGNPANIPAGFTASQLSPYFEEIRLAGIAPGTSYYYGTITLDDDDYNSTGTIDITGWQIKSKDSGEYIPGAIDVYDPSGLTPESDILLKQGDVVYLYSSSAPFNLRLNECIGYIANVADFEPALPLQCPQVDQSQIQSFTGECQEYIDSLDGCSQPNMASPLIPRTDYACQDYLENNFTYKSCFEAHSGDADFLSNQVWVWTGANVVDQYHDTVELLDRNGLLVDIYSY